MREGRPLRFLVATLAGWAGLRALLLWPVAEREALEERAVAARPVPAGVASIASVVASLTPDLPLGHASIAPVRARASARRAMPPPASLRPAPDEATAGAEQFGSTTEPADQRALAIPRPLEPGGASRWSGSAWAIARQSGTGGGLGASQLGGSQAGARLAYALGRERRVSVVGRIATPLEGGGREAALGLEWRPTRLPVRLFAEQRFALDHGRGGPSAGVIGGLYETLPHGFRLEAYGQAGVIARDRVEGFADGAVRATRPVAKLGSATLDLGAGTWGGAQRRVERLDLGPTLGLTAPVAGRTVRLTLDYRARVAGRARPGSGPALSLGTDF